MKRLAGLLCIVVASVLSWAQAPDCASLSQQALQISGMNQEIDAMAQLMVSDDYLNQIAAGKAGGPEFAEVFKPILRKNLMGRRSRKTCCAGRWPAASRRR